MTTIGAARKALRALWADVDDGLEVRVGGRGTFTGDDTLLIGNVSGSNTVPTMGPRRTIEETYDITCTLTCSANTPAESSDQEDLDDRLLGLFAAAEQKLRALPGENLGLGDLGVRTAYVIGDWALTTATATQTQGRTNSALTFRVRVKARYQLQL